MRRTRTIRTRYGVVVVESGRLLARRRAAAGKGHIEKAVSLRSEAKGGLVGDLGRMLRGRGTFPKELFDAWG